MQEREEGKAPTQQELHRAESAFCIDWMKGGGLAQLSLGRVSLPAALMPAGPTNLLAFTSFYQLLELFYLFELTLALAHTFLFSVLV